MKNKIKVKKYKISTKKQDYEVLVPNIPDNSLWVGVLESEDGNGLLGTIKGVQALSIAFEIASRNPFSIVYLPIHDFLIPDIDTLSNMIKVDKHCLLDIVITSTKVQLVRKDWKNIRNKLKHSSYENLNLCYHFDEYKFLEWYDAEKLMNGALNDMQCGTFFIVYPEEFLKYTSREIYDWINEIKEEENYSLKYDEHGFTFYNFYSNHYSFPRSGYNSKKLDNGIYIDCWDVSVMEKLLKRKIDYIKWKDLIRRVD